MKIRKLIVTSVLLLSANCYDALAQCAMCRGSVQTNMSTGRDVIANGLNGGILYLFVFPYILVGAVWYLWYRNSKKG